MNLVSIEDKTPRGQINKEIVAVLGALSILQFRMIEARNIK